MKKQFSSLEEFLEAAPDVTFEMVFDAMLDLSEHYFDDEKLDFAQTGGDPDHVFVKWIVLMKWMHMMTLGKSSRH